MFIRLTKYETTDDVEYGADTNSDSVVQEVYGGSENDLSPYAFDFNTFGKWGLTDTRQGNTHKK